MPKLIDLTGQKFGRLTVLERTGNSTDGKARWICECECGNVLVVQGNHLREGVTRSCGCLAIETRTTHGLANTKIYHTWIAIKQRCLNPNSTNFYLYGERGITICDEWLDFQNFYDYVSKLDNYGEEGYTLDRIDVNGNYEPGNVRWANSKTQHRNTRRSVFVDYYGVKMMITDVAKLTGISENTLRSRARIGLTGEKLFRPVKTSQKKPIDQPTVDNNDSPTEENENLPSTQIFNHEQFGEIRGVMIDGVPYFVGKDVAKALEYERATKAVVDHVDEEDRKMIDGKTQSRFGIELGQRGGWLINESGLYSLILTSKLPKAKEFKRWVTSEVLPSIRKTGKYEINSAPSTKNLPDERKIELLIELAKLSPDDAQKVELINRIAALVF